MPSTITHAYFSMDLYDRFDVNKQKLLKSAKEQFKVFAQGPDVFFFYNLMNLKRGKRIRELGHFMQKNKTQLFFVNLVDTIKQKKLHNNPEVRAFLYGFIAHYVLDMTIHPMVLYKTGIFDKNRKSTHKYFGGHDQMEAYIDAYFMLVRGKVKPHNFNSHRFCFQDTNVSDNLIEIIDIVFKKTFDENSIGNKYKTTIKQMKTFYSIFRNDRTGFKKSAYKIMKVFPFNVKMDVISYNIKLNNNDYYLNLSKDYWYHPLDKNDIYNYSFIELYSIALSKAEQIINEVDKVLLDQKSIKFLYKVFPNLSYLTGRDCKLGTGSYFSF
ncbi:MAG: zinc dependent phospholipase C family protein [Bacilli bacterium]|nr:zinc dependent phospholipase C family protein [Bacilli bacterium]MDD2932158.1 zinc dependent phospholipase C family protein [Fermentimonas sp.]MDD3305177.1 zinc dependent phospholipase C family protein [Bacilli bacterium]MDD4053224.1 zinc dependent phospholipase C family protein [Bacilli bacterium]MDD4411252.1 zinc dependent phospholipase C family protein [Bacilli bacterium]